jgi:hypothetical protein
MALTPEKKRIRKLERALLELLVFLENHRCPYCGGTECPVTQAQKILDGE